MVSRFYSNLMNLLHFCRAFKIKPYIMPFMVTLKLEATCVDPN